MVSLFFTSLFQEKAYYQEALIHLMRPKIVLSEKDNQTPHVSIVNMN